MQYLFAVDACGVCTRDDKIKFCWDKDGAAHPRRKVDMSLSLTLEELFDSLDFSALTKYNKNQRWGAIASVCVRMSDITQHGGDGRFARYAEAYVGYHQHVPRWRASKGNTSSRVTAAKYARLFDESVCACEDCGEAAYRFGQIASGACKL